MRKYSTFLTLVSFFILSHRHLHAQNDSLVAKNGEVIIGTIKEMYKGVLKMKTSYSDSDFAVSWSKVKRLSSTKEFIISSTEGEIFNGALGSETDGIAVIYNAEGVIASILLAEVVYLRTLKSNFLSRLSASLALGYNYTKSNNLSPDQPKKHTGL